MEIITAAPKSPGQEEAELQEAVTRKFLELTKLPEIQEALNIWDTIDTKERLPYHNKEHTLNVIRETILFAVADGATDTVLTQQVIAAAWHDVGFLKQKNQNEPIAVKMFEASEGYKGMNKNARTEVAANILDTALTKGEKSGVLMQLKEKSSVPFTYILDADVSNFGRDDFRIKFELVAKEMRINFDNTVEKKSYYESTISLLKNHVWKSASGSRLREAKMQENLKWLEEEYAQMTLS